MKSATLLGPHYLRIQDVAMPEFKQDEVLVSVKSAGICGFDVASYEGYSTEGIYPFTPGHE